MARPASARSPRRPSADERREEILAVAMRCFATRGFHGTTTRAVAEGVGLTEAALYRYFPSKESLYSAIIERKIEAPSLLEPLEEPARRRDDRAVFGGLARSVLERGTRDPTFIRILFYTALEAHELARPLFEARIEPLRAFVTEYVRGRIADGAFRPVDPQLGARAFLGMLWDYLNVRVVHEQAEAYPQPAAEVADTFTEIFLAGIRAPGVPAGEGAP